MRGRKADPVRGRLLTRIEKSDDGCWLFTGSRDGKGYGHLSENGRLRQAHRVSYEMHVGPIPEGLELDHLCRVRHCVNPAHLEPVDRITNIARSGTPGAVALATGVCQRGHAFVGENVYIYPSGKRQCRPCMAAKSRESKARRSA